MAASLFTDLSRATDSNGAPISGATWNFFVAGTTTPRDVFANAGLNTSLGSIVEADAAGRFVPIFLDIELSYRAVLKDADGVVIDEMDPVSGTLFAAVLSQVQDEFASDTGAALVGGAVQTVPNRAAMAALATSAVRSVAIIDDASLWQWRSGNFAAQVFADPLRGLYQPHTTIPPSSGCWVRQWDGVTARSEWFGARINDAAFDSYAAIQACLNLTGRLTLGKGTYYSSRGLLLPEYCVVQGAGEIHSSIQINHATDHLMRQRGVAGVSYAGGAHLSGFALGRTPNPTTPADAANDISQGHGLHFFMVSNPIVNDVYCYNNLVDFYVGNCLSPHIRNPRGLRQTGGAGDRWYGTYIDGVTAGGTFGGPSPNPSSTIIKPNMIAHAAVGQSWNYYLKGALQDLWLVDPEAAGGHVEFFIDSDGATAGDFHIIRPIADGYRIYGILAQGVPIGSSLNIEGAWVAPAAGATSSGIRLDASHGIDLTARGDFSLNSGLIMLEINDSSGINARLRAVNCQYPVIADELLCSSIELDAFKNYSGADFGVGVELIGGDRNRIKVAARSFDTQKYIAMVKLDAAAANCAIDVSGVLDATAADRIVVNGTPVTTQGNVGGHVIINPGAGAML